MDHILTFIGIDLAWKVSDTPKSRTGLAAISGDGCLSAVALAASDADILSFVRAHCSDRCAVGIDAPLIVPNETGLRPVERTLHTKGIHTYPANRSLFKRVCGGVRGEVLVEKLAADGFQLATHYSAEIKRPVFEVFPSPAYRKLLGLDAIRLKRRKGVSIADIQKGFEAARKKLVSGTLDPPLIIDKRVLDESILGQNTVELRGVALDQFGDALDAVLCAYIIYRYYRNPASTAIFGDLSTGYIIIP